jgi:hypothetical protein
MNEKTLKVLEFNKIINRLSSMATSQLGREIIENLVPSTDIAIVEEMLRETDDAVSYIIKQGNPSLGGIRDIRDSIRRAEIGAVLNQGDLLKVSDVLRLCRNLKAHVTENTRVKEDENVVIDIINQLATNRRIEDKINRAIISEEEISDEASPLLGSIRRQIRSRQEAIKDKLNSMIKSPHYQKYMQEPIVTIRAGRYVIPVKQEYRSEIKGLVHDSSASGATVYIEPMAIVEANNDIKQLQLKEQAEIERILKELTDEVINILPALKSNMSLLAFFITFISIIAFYIYLNYDYLVFKHFISQHYIYTESLDKLYESQLNRDVDGKYYKYFDYIVVSSVTEKIREINNDKYTYLYTPEDVTSIEKAKIVLMKLADEVGMTARRHDKKGRTVQITLKYTDFKTITRQKTVPATYLTKEIYSAGVDLLEKNWNQRKPVRLIGISISGFDEKIEFEQMTIMDLLNMKSSGYISEKTSLNAANNNLDNNTFNEKTGNEFGNEFINDKEITGREDTHLGLSEKEERAKEERLEKVLDELREKHGYSKVTRAIFIKESS